MQNFVFKVDGQKYECPMSAEGVVLEQWIELMDVQKNEMPESLQAILDEEDAGKKKELVDKITEVEYSHRHIPYMAKIVSIMCGMDYDKVVGGQIKMHPKDIEMLYGNCLKTFDNFKVDEEFDGFEFKGVRYEMPKEHMEGSTVIEFMEASQLQEHHSKLAAGVWGALPFVIAVLAKPAGEVYDEANTLIRGEQFKQLDLGTALNVSFFLIRQKHILNQNSLFYMVAHRLKQLKQELAS